MRVAGLFRSQMLHQFVQGEIIAQYHSSCPWFVTCYPSRLLELAFLQADGLMPIEHQI
jgi:hypothetical protein